MTTDLGQLIYKGRLNWLIQGIKLVLLAVNLFMLFALIISFTSSENSINDNIGNQLAGIAFIGVLTLGALAYITNIIRFSTGAVIVYEQGVKFRVFGQWITRRWKEFEQIKLTKAHHPTTVTSKTILFTIYDYAIKDGDGNTITINYNYFFVKFLGELITLPIHNHLFEQYLAKFQQGETLHFGNLTLHKWYVAKGRERKRWLEIDRWEIDQTSVFHPNITFYFEERPILYISLNGVPNASVFISLMDEIEAHGLPHTKEQDQNYEQKQ